MSLLAALLPAEEKEEREKKRRRRRREKRNEKKKRKTLTLLPSTVFCVCVRFFFSSLFSYIYIYVAYMETTRERAKTSSQREREKERRTMMHSANEHTTRFFCVCYVLKRMSIHISFSYIFFLCLLLIWCARKQRNARPLSLLRSRALFYSYIYAQQKSSWVFFLTRTISLTAKV